MYILGPQSRNSSNGTCGSKVSSRAGRVAYESGLRCVALAVRRKQLNLFSMHVSCLSYGCAASQFPYCSLALSARTDEAETAGLFMLCMGAYNV